MYAPPVDIIIAVLLGLLAGAIVAGLVLLLAPGRDRRTAYLRLLWWRVRGAKTAPEIPAGAIAVEHPDAAVARDALNERIAAARHRAAALAAKEAEQQTQSEPIVLSEGDEIVLLEEEEDPPHPYETLLADDDVPGSGSRRI